MDESFKLLLESAGLWLPALTWLLAHLSASRPGRKIDAELKERLKWLKDPAAEKAFHEAFREGIELYEREHGQSKVAKAVARVLAHVAENDTSILDRAIILRQIFAIHPDIGSLSDVVKRYIFALEGEIVTVVEVSKALEELLLKYLRPSFRTQPYFTQQVGFVEIVGLLDNILQEVSLPKVDLEKLRGDYRTKMATMYEFLTMQGISPKVQNRTIGIRMKDIFIPLKVILDVTRFSDLP